MEIKHTYTFANYAKLKGCTRSNITQLANKGKLTIVKINGKRFVYDKDISRSE